MKTIESLQLKELKMEEAVPIPVNPRGGANRGVGLLRRTILDMKVGQSFQLTFDSGKDAANFAMKACGTARTARKAGADVWVATRRSSKGVEPIWVRVWRIMNPEGEKK